MVCAVIMTHGRLAFEIVATAGKIIGKVDCLHPFSNDDLSAEAFCAQVEGVLSDLHAEKILAMVDLRGGSCWMAARLLSRRFPGTRVLSGVNLPMIIAFLNKKDKFPFHELIEILEKEGHKGITLE